MPISRALFAVVCLSAAVSLAQELPGAPGAPDAGLEVKPGPGGEASQPTKDQPTAAALPFALPQWLGRIKFWGWATVYAFPFYERAFPDPNKNLFRVRFARLVVDFTPHEDALVRLQLAGEQASSALFFDYFVTWKHFEFANVTVGQQKIFLGASISQPGFELAMLERPRFITQLTKQNFRDIGVTLHTARGPGQRVFEYSLGLYNGSGRVPFAANVPTRGDTDVLIAARAIVNPAPLFLGKQARIALGVTAAVESTGASPDATVARNNLGMNLVPWNTARTTYLLGADLHVTGIAGLWLMAEVMWLHSQARPDGTSRRLLGWYVEAGFTPAILGGLFQPVARFEWADTDLSVVANEEMIASAGVNVRPLPWLLASAFFTRAELFTLGESNRIELRLQARY